MKILWWNFKNSRLKRAEMAHNKDPDLRDLAGRDGGE